MSDLRAFGLVRAGGLAVVLALGASPLAAQYSIPWHVVAGGGGTSCNPHPACLTTPGTVLGEYSLSGTAGQHDAGTLTLSPYLLNGGFWAWDGSAANLSIVVADAPSPLPLGSDVTYTITVTNVGPTLATGIRLTNTMPDGASYVGSSVPCVQALQVLTCDLPGNLPSLAFTNFTVTVHPYLPQSNVDAASGYPAEVDLVTANNTDTGAAYLLHPFLNVSNAPAAEGGTADFNVTLSAQSMQTVTVSFATLDGTAKAADGDYGQATGTVTFPPLSTTQPIPPVPVIADAVVESSETFAVVLHNAANASIADAQGLATIDPSGAGAQALTLSIDDVTVQESSPNATLTVTLSANPPSNVTVDWATADGNATAGSDYASTGSSLVFTNGGSLTQQVVVPVSADGTDEQNEAFKVVLSNPGGATIADAEGQGTILDDDGRPALCLPIVTVPFTISASGSYCLATNLTTPQTSGAAITVDADGVLLDLKGFTIDGSGVGTGTQAYGIHASDHSDITVRGGSVRGFLAGVQLDATGFTSGHVVRNMRLDENRFAGIWAEGTGTRLLNNLVLQTGGTTALGTNADAYGIVVRGESARVLNNDVVSVSGTIDGQSAGIELREAAGSVVERNRVSNTAASASTGIQISTGYDVLVIENRLANLGFGIKYMTGLGKYRGNLATGIVDLVFGAATDAGNNHPLP